MINHHITTMIQGIISEYLSIDIEEFKQRAKFKNQIQVDSLELIEITMKIEEEFDIDILNDEFDSLQSIQDFIHHIATAPSIQSLQHLKDLIREKQLARI